MKIAKCRVSRLILPLLTIALISGLPAGNTSAAEGNNSLAFSEKFMIRLSSYSVNQASTDISVLSSGIGTIISFDEDLGGENSATIPRFDAYYRFNERHRIDFSNFNIDREGLKTLDIDIVLDGITYAATETVKSEIKYSLIKLGYAYSFYRSPSVELSLTAGLNITEYDFNFFSLDDSSKSSINGVTAPLPMFGLRLGYAINSNWSVNYISETFAVELEDTFKGIFLNFELNLEYKFDNKIAFGAGLVKSSIDLEVDDSDWTGSIVDSYRGGILYAAYYF